MTSIDPNMLSLIYVYLGQFDLPNTKKELEIQLFKLLNAEQFKAVQIEAKARSRINIIKQLLSSTTLHNCCETIIDNLNCLTTEAKLDITVASTFFQLQLQIKRLAIIQLLSKYQSILSANKNINTNNNSNNNNNNNNANNINSDNNRCNCDSNKYMSNNRDCNNYINTSNSNSNRYQNITNNSTSLESIYDFEFLEILTYLLPCNISISSTNDDKVKAKKLKTIRDQMYQEFQSLLVTGQVNLDFNEQRKVVLQMLNGYLNTILNKLQLENTTILEQLYELHKNLEQ